MHFCDRTVEWSSRVGCRGSGGYGEDAERCYGEDAERRYGEDAERYSAGCGCRTVLRSRACDSTATATAIRASAAPTSGRSA